MKRKSFLLLEVLVGLALLALLGVWIVRVQAAALRQWAHARQLRQATVAVESLLASWSDTHTVVTLPGSGELADGLRWQRECGPAVPAAGVQATAVRLVVRSDSAGQPPRDVLHLAWLVPAAARRP